MSELEMTANSKHRAPELGRRVVTIVGAYGSGKSEIAVNLAIMLAGWEAEPVTLADLDVINPYFRSREAAVELEKMGIRSLVPPGAQASADLPIVIPEIKGAIQQSPGRLVLDVGGDDLGATVLRSLADAFVPGEYDLLLAHNANRPFTSDLPGTLKVINEIERSCGLKMTGLIANSHLIQLTTVETVMTGLDLTKAASEASGLPILFVSIDSRVLAEIKPGQIDLPLLEINRSLLKPWERKSTS